MMKLGIYVVIADELEIQWLQVTYLQSLCVCYPFSFQNAILIY